MPDFRRTTLVVYCLFFTAGCGGGQKAFVPKTSAAQASLERALAAWKNGGKVGELTDASPTLNAEDSQWRKGKKLAAYEILSETPGAPDAPRRFKVSLTLEGGKPEETEFVVFGKDPIFVYRDADYEKQFLKGM